MSRHSMRQGTKFHVCPSCAVGSKGQAIWGYHGRAGRRELILHRVRAHNYSPTPTELRIVRRFV